MKPSSSLWSHDDSQDKMSHGKKRIVPPKKVWNIPVKGSESSDGNLGAEAVKEKKKGREGPSGRQKGGGEGPSDVRAQRKRRGEAQPTTDPL